MRVRLGLIALLTLGVAGSLIGLLRDAPEQVVPLAPTAREQALQLSPQEADLAALDGQPDSPTATSDEAPERQLHSGRLEGVLRDRVTTKPLPAVALLLIHEGDPGKEQVLTDLEGRFTSSFAIPAGNVRVRPHPRAWIGLAHSEGTVVSFDPVQQEPARIDWDAPAFVVASPWPPLHRQGDIAYLIYPEGEAATGDGRTFVPSDRRLTTSSVRRFEDPALDSPAALLVFAKRDLPSGTGAIELMRRGFEPRWFRAEDVVLGQGLIQSQTVRTEEQPPGAAVSLRVLGEDGEPLPAAHAELERSWGRAISPSLPAILRNHSNYFDRSRLQVVVHEQQASQLDWMQPGSYRLQVRAPGYHEEIQVLDLNGATTHQVEVSLDPLAEQPETTLRVHPQDPDGELPYVQYEAWWQPEVGTPRVQLRQFSGQVLVKRSELPSPIVFQGLPPEGVEFHLSAHLYPGLGHWQTPTTPSTLTVKPGHHHDVHLDNRDLAAWQFELPAKLHESLHAKSPQASVHAIVRILDEDSEEIGLSPFSLGNGGRPFVAPQRSGLRFQLKFQRSGQAQVFEGELEATYEEPHQDLSVHVIRLQPN